MKFLLLFTSLLSFTSFAQSVNYRLRMDTPQSHYFQVEMDVKDLSKSEVLVKMPIWAPGSYLAREFAKSVDLVTARGESGKQLNVKKINKNTWKITKSTSEDITISYEVYAFELTVRTSFLDLTHGFVSGTSVFMYVDGLKEKSGYVDIYPYKGFAEITTALKPTGDGSTGDAGTVRYAYNDYDQLVDCPIEIGNQEVFTFEAAGVHHTVGMYGDGNYDVAQLKKDMANIVEAATDVFGFNPNEDYTFIIHNVQDGQGGLEHMNSTTLSVNRFTYSGSQYKGFLSLVAHEYFHLWNVKRIRPVELGPFDYDSENYTSLLWVMEGFTSYYDELLLLRAGYYTQDEYLRKLFGTLNYVEGSPGARVQPVAHASFDAWIKAYRPNENAPNTTISYYSKGSVIAAMLDAKIIRKYNGKKCLDDFLQHLYEKYYKGKNRGFSEDEFQDELSAFLKEDLTQFFEDYIYGTKIPNYNEVFRPLGISVTYDAVPRPSVGMSLKGGAGETKVSYVRRGSAAEDAGLSVHDEIIGCNGLRVDKQSLEEFFPTLAVGDRIELLISRDQQLYSVELVVTPYEKPHFSWANVAEGKAKELYNYWLRSN